MKIITLNTWGGRKKSAFLDFLKNNEADIFCFQEVFRGSDEKTEPLLAGSKDANINLYKDIATSLPNHIGIFTPLIGESYGLAMFIKNDIPIAESGHIVLHENNHYTIESARVSDHTRKLQWMKIKDGDRELCVSNVHGYWTAEGVDTKHSLIQSEKIRQFLSNSSLPTILCGDFNLMPQTKSIQIFSEDPTPLTNLPLVYNIEHTRTDLCGFPKKFLVDYIFTSPDIIAKRFAVLPDVVSDHAPLLMEF
jgi:endonuclease/exonuclease/phosphatase family metal-dependent hydrolase